MDFAAALDIASKAVDVFMKIEPIVVKGVPVVIQGAKDLKVFAEAFIQKLTGNPITEDQRTELEAKLDDLHAQFQKPIPPESER